MKIEFPNTPELPVISKQTFTVRELQSGVANTKDTVRERDTGTRIDPTMKDNRTLDEIGIANQTDKASQFTRTYAKPHDYLRVMEPFFEPMRDKPIKFLEIGVGGGESIQTWIEYFPHAYVVGVDISKNTNPYNAVAVGDSVGIGVHPRYIFFSGDQGDASFWAKLIERNGPSFDVFCDDGSHYASDIITTFNSLWPHIAPSGIYIIEDLNTSYGGAPFTVPGQPTQMDFIKGLLDHTNHQSMAIDRIHFSRELCIIQKTHV